MTLHELAESLRKVAYELDQANEKWDSNDRHVAGLNDRIRSFITERDRLLRERNTAELALAKAQARLKRSRRAKKAKR